MRAPDPNSQKGELILYTGPMNSGKTETLVKHALNLMNHASQRVAGFSIFENTRDGLNQIVGENGDKLNATSVSMNSPQNILKHVYDFDKSGFVDVVVLDEVSFYNHEIIPTINSLRSDNRLVLAAGLDKSFRGEPFGVMPYLKEMVPPHSLESTTFNSYCKIARGDEQCCNLATYTVRLKRESEFKTSFFDKEGNLVEGYGFAPYFDPLKLVEKKKDDGPSPTEYTSACEDCFQIPLKDETVRVYESLISGFRAKDIKSSNLDKIIDMLVSEDKIVDMENGFYEAKPHFFDLRSGAYIPQN